MSPAQDVLWQAIDGQIVLMSMKDCLYYRLDAVGSRMWELLVQHGDVDAAGAGILAEFQVDPQRVADDVEAFVAGLAAAAW